MSKGVLATDKRGVRELGAEKQGWMGWGSTRSSSSLFW